MGNEWTGNNVWVYNEWTGFGVWVMSGLVLVCG